MNNLPSLPKAALSRRKFLGTTLAGTVAHPRWRGLDELFQHRTRPRPEQPQPSTLPSRRCSTATSALFPAASLASIGT
jgi:hypothetical protein